MRISLKNKYFSFTWIFLVGFLLAESPQSGAQQTVRLGQDNSGQTTIVKKGSTIILTLTDRVDGGYRFDSIRYDTKILRLQKHSQTPPADNSSPGASGTGSWQFAALTAGVSKVTVTATRPWQGGGTVTVFENEVDVK